MKIALIGDVHANLPALQAVLDHSARSGAGRIWNTGDFLGYNAFPEEVVQTLRTADAVSVIGNYDQKVLKFPLRNEKWEGKKRREKWLAFKFAYEQLSQDSLDYLASLPEQRRITVAGQEALLVHGSPAAVDEHLYPDTVKERFVQLAKLAGSDLVVCGHSHQGFVRRVGESWFVNTGSVGRPDDGDPRASYAMLELTKGSVDIRLTRVEYDVEAAVEGIRQKGLPSAFEDMMRKGRRLDWILDGSLRER